MAEYALYAVFAYAASRIAANLLQKDEKQPLVEQKPGTTSTRGSWVPQVIGRRRIGPFVAWVGDRVVLTESGGSGGKGASGGAVQQTVYYESAMHMLAVGPGRRVRKCWANGKIVWSGSISPESHPSGSVINLTGIEGKFYIYWGHVDQPVSSYFTDSGRFGIPSRFPNVMWIGVRDFRLGGYAVWPLVEWEIEVHPYREGDDNSADYNTLPTRLANSTDWYRNSKGIQTPWEEILTVQAGFPTWIKLADIDGSVAARFPDDSLARIRFQPVDYNNTDFVVDSASWSSSEQIDTFDGIYTDAGGYNAAVSAWTLGTDTDPVVTVTGSSYPPRPSGYTVGDRYILLNHSLDIAVPGSVYYQMTGGGSTFVDGANRFTVWVHGLGLTGDLYANGKPPSQYVILSLVGTSGAVTHSHYSKFSASGGGISITNSNGAIGKVVLDYGDWKLLQVEYYAGTGSSPSDSSYNRRLVVLFDASSTCALFTALVAPDYLVDEDAGTTVTGVTTVTLKQGIVDLVDNLGDIAPMVAGLGPYEGANPAHVLHQLLFAKWPLGSGLDESDYDIDSLEEVGVALGEAGEGYRCHVIGLDGQKAEGVIASILLDCGIAISWDVETGKYRFDLVREQSLAETPHIPSRGILDPGTEARVRHLAKGATSITLGFPDPAQAYRSNSVPFADDGEAGRRGAQTRISIAVTTAIDRETAVMAGVRRAQAELSAPASFKIQSAWEARLLRAGMAVQVDGLETGDDVATKVLRIAEIQAYALSSRVDLTLLADVYGTLQLVGGLTPTSGAFGGDLTGGPPIEEGDVPDEQEAPPDISVGVLELSGFLSPDTAAVVVMRHRSSRGVAGAEIHFSPNGSSYRSVGVQERYAGGGSLMTAIDSGSSWYIDNGPIFLDDVGDTIQWAGILSDSDWLSGRVVAVIDDEIFFPGIIASVGGNLWQLRRVIRGRYERGRQAHAAGARVFVFRMDRIAVWRDPVLQAERDLFVKTQPRLGAGGGGAPTLDDVVAVQEFIEGYHVVPLPPTNLRTANLSNSYSTGASPSFKWGWRSRLGKILRSGMGFQRYGEALRRGAPVEGEFILTIKDGGIVKRTVSTTATSWIYPNADLVSDLGSEKSFDVELVYMLGTKSSATATITVTKV